MTQGASGKRGSGESKAQRRSQSVNLFIKGIGECILTPPQHNEGEAHVGQAELNHLEYAIDVKTSASERKYREKLKLLDPEKHKRLYVYVMLAYSRLFVYLIYRANLDVGIPRAKLGVS